MSTLRTQLLQTAQAYIDGLNNSGEDAAGVVSHRTPDCLQRILPTNLKQPMRTNDEYQAFMKQSAAFVKSITFSLPEDEAPLVDETARRVMLHFQSKGDTVFGPYENEYFIILAMTDDGSQIKEVTEFLDTQVFVGFVGAVEKALQGGQSQA